MSKHKVNKSQEGSAYWHYVLNKPSYLQDGDVKEDIDANPDQLSEEDTIIHKSKLTDEQEEDLASYYRLVNAGILKKLAPRQREVWKLRFFRWCSEEEIVEKLGISLSAVRSHLARAGAKIKEEILKQQKKKQMLNGNYFNDGFKKQVHSVGESKTDEEFGDRLEKGQKEIDEFCKKHPELGKE